jgi:uncharacterized membrane protein YuzA (DUF378 family)
MNCKLKLITSTLTTVGALNWGLVGLFGFDLVDRLFGGISLGQTATAATLVYITVGAAGLFSVYCHIKCCFGKAHCDRKG